MELKTWNDPPNDFQDSFYLATHVVYAMSAYSGIKVAVEDCPWVYRYIRKSYRFWMKQDKLKRTQVGGWCLRGASASPVSRVCECPDIHSVTQEARMDIVRGCLNAQPGSPTPVKRHQLPSGSSTDSLMRANTQRGRTPRCTWTWTAWARWWTVCAGWG